MHTREIREIRKSDEPALAAVIRGCFHDYDATQQGTVFSDSVIDHLYDEFHKPGAAYFVLEIDGEVMGGAGIQQLKGGDQGVGELQKMYLKKESRGKGYGRALLGKCLEFGKTQGFHTCYLESLPELTDALRMYERAGFSYIPERMGNTGYFGCTLFMALKL